ncbi:hypothetical protein FA15DRAFT_663834 [Coprinopsis marcescibilis]|uniref:Uncharacterized protein n=1 Tax=Coprinopsis marcescibilis TaxID=230819 RepID=A0A5C3LLW2_COPMA|nr:hypothetical protein FA15DRAFT_663834 [Coprinopsis marcescibilis]
MSIVIRDARVSILVPTPVELERTPARRVRPSAAKRFERRMTNLWKLFTNTSGRQRASVYSTNFVNITSRRRSTLPSQFIRATA